MVFIDGSPGNPARVVLPRRQPIASIGGLWFTLRLAQPAAAAARAQMSRTAEAVFPRTISQSACDCADPATHGPMTGIGRYTGLAAAAAPAVTAGPAPAPPLPRGSGRAPR